MSDNGNEFPLVSDRNGKRYREETGDNGDLLRVYETGSVYNMTKKHLVAGLSDNRITTETAPDYHQARRDQDAEFRENGIIQAVRDNVPVKGEVDRLTALYALAYVNAETALAGGAGSVQAYREAKKDLGIMEAGKLNGRDAAEAVAGATRDIMETAMRIIAAQQRENEENIIDA